MTDPPAGPAWMLARTVLVRSLPVLMGAAHFSCATAEAITFQGGDAGIGAGSDGDVAAGGAWGVGTAGAPVVGAGGTTVLATGGVGTGAGGTGMGGMLATGSGGSTGVGTGGFANGAGGTVGSGAGGGGSNPTCPTEAQTHAAPCALPGLVCAFEGSECTCTNGAWDCECPDNRGEGGDPCVVEEGRECDWGLRDCVCENGEWDC